MVIFGLPFANEKIIFLLRALKCIEDKLNGKLFQKDGGPCVLKNIFFDFIG